MAESCAPNRSIIGLDFGTLTTSAAILKAGKLEMIKDSFGQDVITPSCVLFAPKSETFKGRNRDSILVGDMAKRLEQHHRKSVVVEMKRFLGKFSDDLALTCDRHFYPHEIVHDRNKQVMLKLKGEGTFSPVEVSAVFLKEFKLNAEKQLGFELDQAVVTVPSSYGFCHRLALKEACSAAGLKVVRLVNEATAVALAHGRSSPSSQLHRLMLVICIGAAFVSISLVSVKHGRLYREKAVRGLSDLGGNNFDIRVMNHMIAQIKTLTGKDFSLNNKTMMANLRKGVKALKNNLTEHEEATVHISLESGGTVDLSLTRADFEKLNANLFAALLEPVGRVLEDSELRKEQIDDIVLAGGSCRIPCIQKLFYDYFDHKSLSFSFFDCITQAAVGAAILGANLERYEDESISDLVQVIPHSIGVEVEGRKLGIAIKANSVLPQCITKTFSTHNNYQCKALIAVYEGEKLYTKDNFCLGQVILKNLREEPKGFPEIDVTIEVDNNYDVIVKVQEVNSQQEGISFKVSKESILVKLHKDELKSMAIIDRAPTDEKAVDIDGDWEHINFNPALQLEVKDDLRAENKQNQHHNEPRPKDSALAFKPLIQRHSRANLFKSLSVHPKKLSQVMPEHSRASSESNIFKDESVFQEMDEHQNDLQHALSIANSALRRIEIEKDEAIVQAEEADARAAKLEKQRNMALQRVEDLENALQALDDRNGELQADLDETSERAVLYFSQFNRVCEILKEKETDAVDHQLLWVVQRDEIEITDEELGRGGWGTVHKANFRGITVAAKRIHGHIISDYNRDLFKREMSIASRIRHPNLAQFIGATAQKEQELIILIEMMSTTLWEELQTRPLSQLEIASISLDVARALNYLHLMRPDPIIHRDVSSANVLLNPGRNGTWITKLSDYGSANYFHNAVTQGPGNAAYAAPDTIQTPGMDVFSFGVLLLEISIRKIPDSRSTQKEREALICQVSSIHLQNLIRLCTTPVASGRPTMAEIIQSLTLTQ